MSAPLDDLAEFADDPRHPKGPRRAFSFGRLLALLGLIAVAVALFLPATRTARPAAYRMQCANNLKQIALALQNYEAFHHALPPAATLDPAGRPLHSWRTLILPFMEQKELYDSIDLTKPWDDPANAKARATAVSAYRCPVPGDLPATSTTYLAVVAPGGCFLPGRPRALSEIVDDHATTLMVIETPTERAVPWMTPLDADAAVMAIGPGSPLSHAGGSDAAFVDGSVRFLKSSLRADLRSALISIAGGERLSADEF